MMKKEKFTEKELHFKFVNICKSGDLINFRKFYNEYYLKNRSIFSSFLKIINKKPALHLDDPNSMDGGILLMSAMSGQYDIVKEFFKDEKYVDKINQNGLLKKSVSGILGPQRLSLAPVEYPIFKQINELMYQCLKNKEEFHLTLNLCFLHSCNQGDLNTVKYLMETPHFQEYLDFDRKKLPPEYHLIKVTSIEILNYLIIENDMEQDKNFFEKILHTNDVLSIVEKKNLNYDLNDNLLVNEEANRTKKRPKL